MPRFFHSVAPQYVTYVKMYSTFRTGATKNCFAFILMPYSSQSVLTSIQSIQFDFNIQGEVQAIHFRYAGQMRHIDKKKQETKEAVAALEVLYDEKGLCFIHPQSNMLTLELIICNHAKAFLTDVLEIINKHYYLNPNYSKTISSQLLDQQYLSDEFIRLRGTPSKTHRHKPQKNEECLIM